MHKNDNISDYKQVRTAKGGGTRHVTVEKNTNVQEVKSLAENLFFPGGKSKELQLKNLHCEMCDIQQNVIDKECTIDKLYEITKVKLLRLYLCTRKKGGDMHDRGDEILAPGEATNEVKLQDEDKEVTDRETIILAPGETTNDEQLEDEHLQDIDREVISLTPAETQNEEQLHDFLQVYVQEDSAVFTGPFSENEVVNLDDTIPLADPQSVIIVVRRGFCLSDLMEAFGDPSIMKRDVKIRMKLPSGSLEKGEGSGVFRDCLCEFWGEFYSRCTLGDTVKVPFLMHEFQLHEWQVIGRILVKGWLAVGYFPIRLSLPFLEEALYSKTYSSIKESFMLYISKPDREILEEALNDFGSVEIGSLIDVLDCYECHQVPNQENITDLLSQLGHKALIQTPMFVIECWRPVLKAIANTLSPQEWRAIVQNQIPTTKRVKEILNFPSPMNAAQNNVAKHLKKYIGELDEKGLQSFLRFCTGSDVLFGSHITVHFIETNDFQCRPQASTCGCFLNLPINYQHCPDLRSDFNAILNSSVWVVDTI